MAGEHGGTRHWERGGRRVIECRQCGYRHLDPVPGAGELAEFYRSSYHREVKPFPHYGADDRFVARMGEEIAARRDYREIFETVSGLVAPACGRSMLDIGCGNQLLAKYFADRGWRATVLEPNHDAAGWLRRFGLDVVEAMIEEVDGSGGAPHTFVNLQYVLEHLLDPLGALRKVAGMMAEGGILRVCVPNDFSEGQMAWLEVSGMDAPWINWPDHINYFDFDSLTRLLARAGFSEAARSTTFPLETLLLSGIDYYRSEEDRQRVGAIVSSFENAFVGSGRERLLERYYEGLARLGFGRNVIIYARRG